MHDWLEAEQAAERAQQFYEAGQWDKAVAALEIALSVNPDQSDWHFGKGMALDAMQRYSEAADSFEQVVRLRGEQVDPMLRLGVDLIRSQQPQRAVGVLERVLELDPAADQARCYLIKAYALTDEHDKAEETYYLAQQQHGDEACPLCLDHIAYSLYARDQLDKAGWCWRQVEKLSPRHEDVHANQARVAWRQGRLEEARDLYLRQLREEPGHLDVLLQCGRLLLVMGHFPEAGEKFRRIVELDPTIADAHYHLGELALRSGHLDAAAGQFEMAGRLAPELPGVHLNLAAVAVLRRKPHDALEQLDQELALEGQSGQQVIDMARLLVELDAPEKAIDLMQPILSGRTEPLFDDEAQLAEALLCRGVALVLAGETDEAIADFRLTLQLSPRHEPALYNLVVAYHDQHRHARARAVLRRALEVSPDDADLRHLAQRLRRDQWVQRVRAAWAKLTRRG